MGGPDGKRGTFQTYVLAHLPVTLWGRDILTQMDVVSSSVEQNMSCLNPTVLPVMVRQGYIPGKGLGKNVQSVTCPIQAEGQTGTEGLCFPEEPLNH